MSVVLGEGDKRVKEVYNICDFGCGTGLITKELLQFGPTTGIDLSKKAIELAGSRWPGIDFVCGDLLEYDPERLFDIVVSTEVIEHIPDQEEFVRAISRVLEPGGWVILTCPNKRAKRAAEKLGHVNQPIELWLTRRRLKSLFKREFHIIRHRTVVLNSLG